MAARNGHVKIVEYLASLVDNPNAPNLNDETSRTPLQLALKKGHTEVVKFLSKFLSKKVSLP